MRRRLGTAPWLVLWAVLLGLQGLAFTRLGPIDPLLALGAALLLQLAKLPISAWRLNDLGRPPDDAMLALVPLANIVLWRDLLRGTPTDAQRDAAIARWSDGSLALDLFLRGARDLVRSPGASFGLGLVFAVAYAGGDLAITELLLGAGEYDPGTVAIAGQVLWGLTAFLGAYLVVQVLKRRTASRASWWPTFLFLPMGLSALALQVASSTGPANPQDVLGGPVPLVLASQAFQIVWMCYAGAALGILWVSVAEAARVDHAVGVGEILTRLRTRLADVSTPHATAGLIIMLGMQVILPGIHYALQYAFVDVIAVLDPERPALRRSRAISTGIRRRIMKVFVMGLLCVVGLGWLAAVPSEVIQATEPEPMSDLALRVFTGVPTSLVFPIHITGLSEYTLFPLAAVSVLVWGATRAAMVHLYHERVAAEGSARRE